MTLLHRFWLLALLGGVMLSTGAARAQDVEWEETTPYYEDDSWYDISEWFDGNDYNPTDEVTGRIDDETYQARRDRGYDQDNDWPAVSSYGYDDRRENDDWFYGYYDFGDTTFSDSNRDGMYDYAYWYFDYDDDGAYDSYAYMYDSDNDGTYDISRFYTFGDQQGQGRERQQQDEQARQMAESMSSSKARQVSGTINKTKKVSVRDTKHMVAAVKNKDGDQVMVDLGPVSDARNFDLKKGDKLTAQGPMAKVGDKPILLATKLKLDNRTVSVDRSKRQLTGEVADTRTAKIRGREHQMLILAPQQGKKCLVDLGPASRFGADLQQGDQVTVHGIPVKVNDRKVVMARSVQHDGKTVQIDRRDRKSQTASRQQGDAEQRTGARQTDSDQSDNN